MRNSGQRNSRIALVIAASLASALAGAGAAGAKMAPPGPDFPLGPPSAAQIALQVKAPRIVDDLEQRLGDGYAGVWIDPAQARYNVGVTAVTDRAAALGVLGSLGVTLQSDLVPVESTWDELVAARDRWVGVVGDLLASGDAIVGIDTSRNAVAVTVSNSVPTSRLAALEDAAVRDAVNVAIDVLPAGATHVTPDVGGSPVGGRLASLRRKLERRAHKRLGRALGCVRADVRRSHRNRLSILVTNKHAARWARRLVRHTRVENLRARGITRVRRIKRRNGDAAIGRVRARVERALGRLGSPNPHLRVLMRGIPTLTRCDPVTILVAPGHTEAELSWARAQRGRYGSRRVVIARGTLPD